MPIPGRLDCCATGVPKPDSGPGILGIAGHHLLCRAGQVQPWHVLNVCRQQERASFDDENAQTDVLATTVNLVRDIPAEHAGPDDDNVERVAAIAGHFAPSAAHPAAKHVMRERGLLDINDKVRIGVEARQHRRLLWRRWLPPVWFSPWLCSRLV